MTATPSLLALMNEIAWIRLTPPSAIEVVEPPPHGHRNDCAYAGSHDWRRVGTNELPGYPDAEFVCERCSALGVLVRPMSHGENLQ